MFEYVPKYIDPRPRLGKVSKLPLTTMNGVRHDFAKCWYTFAMTAVALVMTCATCVLVDIHQSRRRSDLKPRIVRVPAGPFI